MSGTAMKLELIAESGKFSAPDKPIFEERNLVCSAPDIPNGIVKANLSVCVTARWYRSARKDSQMIYCCLWVFGKDNSAVGYRSGSGSAGGYGYCKRSAAFADALQNAGFKTPFDSISGAGMYAVDDAIKGIGLLLGYNVDNMIVVGE